MTDPTDTTHECPGPLCIKRVDRDKLACAGHWYQVDKETQAWVWRTFRHGPIGEHVAAMDAAIAQMRPFKADIGRVSQ